MAGGPQNLTEENCLCAHFAGPASTVKSKEMSIYVPPNNDLCFTFSDQSQICTGSIYLMRNTYSQVCRLERPKLTTLSLNPNNTYLPVITDHTEVLKVDSQPKMKQMDYCYSDELYVDP